MLGFEFLYNFSSLFYSDCSRPYVSWGSFCSYNVFNIVFVIHSVYSNDSCLWYILSDEFYSQGSPIWASFIIIFYYVFLYPPIGSFPSVVTYSDVFNQFFSIIIFYLDQSASYRGSP